MKVTVLLCVIVSTIFGGYSLVTNHLSPEGVFGETRSLLAPVPPPEDALPREAGLPDHVLYMFIFKHAANARGARIEKRLADSLQISRAEFVLFQRIARECDHEVRSIDSQATAIIEQSRSIYPEGKLPAREAPPPPPANLLELQETRKNAILRHRETLRRDLRAESVAAIEDYVRRQIASKVNRH